MKEEEIIKKRCGKENPFRVPEGYFDDFTSNLMDKLPEKESHTIQISSRYDHSRMLRSVLCVAASVCFAIFSTLYFFNRSCENETSERCASHGAFLKTTNDELIDRTADYAMMDNHDIYACMSYDE